MFKYEVEMIVENAKQMFNKGDIANYKMALHQLDKIFKKQYEEIVGNPQSVNVTEFNKLKDMQNYLLTNLGRLEEKVRNMPSEGPLSFELQKKIYHTYHAGYNTQVQLAQFYGVKQPFISKIVNDHKKFSIG